ncbi:MAG TPA: hypothetical protein VN040_14770, partial [Pseudosphingobacterium sp.]|nr:hypothetical protein [Pseudosphingobacterium sp.]
PVAINLSSSGEQIRSYYISNQDPELDVFTVTLGGKSVRFVIGKNQQIFPLDPCDWRIEYQFNDQYPYAMFSANSFIDRFTITDENGNKYSFRSLSWTRSSVFTPCPSEGPCPTLYNSMVNGKRSPITEWEIEKITTYNGSEIVFNYTNKFPTDANLIFESKFMGAPQTRSVKKSDNTYCYRFPGDNDVIYNTSYQVVCRPYLKTIVFPDGATINFIYSNVPRLDAINIAPDLYSYPLKEIRLGRNSNPTTIYNLHQSYFYTTGNGTLPYANNGTQSWGNNHNLRLKLDSISVTPQYANLSYKFDYDMNTFLPNKTRYSIDHWGYNNGVNNLGLLQVDPELGWVSHPPTIVWPGEGTREANGSYITSNMLKKISFNDNSSVEYEFEPNMGRMYDFHTGLQNNQTMGGGVRIKKITLFDGISHTNDIVKRIEYLNADNTNSGILFSIPKYSRDIECTEHGSARLSTTNSNVASWGYTYKGSSVGYSRVTVFNGQNGEGGKEVYEFSNLVDGNELNLVPNASDDLPYANRQYINDWKIGLLKKKSIYNSNGGLVQQILNEYNSGTNFPDPSVLSHFRSVKYDVKVGWPQGITNQNCSNTSIPWDFYKLEYYPVSGFSNLARVIQNDYSGVDILSKTTEYFYNAKQHLVKQIDKTTDQRILEKRFYRVYDYVSNAQNVGFANLVNANRSSEVVRSDYLFRETSNSPAFFLSSDIKTFKDVFIDGANGIYRVQPGSVFKMQLKEPLAESVIGTISPTNSLLPTTLSDYYYEDEKFYYNDGGLLTGVNKSGLERAMLYDGFQIIAEATNASEKDLAYTSFENGKDAEGGWLLETIDIDNSKGYSGQRSAKPTRNPIVLMKSLNPLQTYKISMWSKSGPPLVQFNTGPSISLTSEGETTLLGWTLFSGTFTGRTNCYIPSGTQVDEIRLAPVGSAMKTYSFESLSGIRSTCNEQNVVQNNIYDLFGRLIEIVDQDGNIIKQFRYNQGVNN